MTTPRPLLEAENRLERFNADRERIVAEVERRILSELHARAAGSSERALEYVLNDVAYHEIQRLEAEGKHADRLAEWRHLAGQLGRMSEEDKRDHVATLVHRYAMDVVGNFNPRVYRVANDVLPSVLSLLFTPARTWSLGNLGDLAGRIRIEGPIDTLRALTERGTLIVTPTHSSNMDSVAVGFALRQAGLPPVTYGAGKNLFSNRILSFFMHNLGAYRVDRRLRFALYKDVLKEYSTVLLESGYHSLFFPGGTRCRSNIIEKKLKLGLLGTALAAYQSNVAGGSPFRRMYIVPLTINYRLCLEAETLIDDYLAETGKSRYIIEDDESSRVGRIAEFMRKTLAHEGAVVLRFGMPFDPMGNAIDGDGESRDRRGRRVDPARYLTGADGAARADGQRDAEYTRLLGQQLVRAFHRETVLQSTAIAARALFDAASAAAGTRDIYKLIRLGPDSLTVPAAEVLAGIDRLRARVAADPEQGTVDQRWRDAPAGELLDDALRAFATYHSHPVAERAGDDVVPTGMKLVYYYQNRTAHLPPEARA
jgi:glycerol-3-phosphate O-acyltransferase